jgi:hypothetical protein
MLHVVHAPINATIQGVTPTQSHGLTDGVNMEGEVHALPTGTPVQNPAQANDPAIDQVSPAAQHPNIDLTSRLHICHPGSRIYSTKCIPKCRSCFMVTK